MFFFPSVISFSASRCASFALCQVVDIASCSNSDSTRLRRSACRCDELRDKCLYFMCPPAMAAYDVGEGREASDGSGNFLMARSKTLMLDQVALRPTSPQYLLAMGCSARTIRVQGLDEGKLSLSHLIPTILHPLSVPIDYSKQSLTPDTLFTASKSCYGLRCGLGKSSVPRFVPSTRPCLCSVIDRWCHPHNLNSLRLPLSTPA